MTIPGVWSSVEEISNSVPKFVGALLQALKLRGLRIHYRHKVSVRQIHPCQDLSSGARCPPVSRFP
jgi:hypothetical protein